MKLSITLASGLLATLPLCTSAWTIFGRRHGSEFLHLKGHGTKCVNLQRPIPGNRALFAELEPECKAYAFRYKDCEFKDEGDSITPVELKADEETKVLRQRDSILVTCH